jgi:flagellar motor switch protein FliN/FliY
MPQATETQQDNAAQEDVTVAEPEVTTPVHSVDFPEAQENGNAEPAGQLDLLLDMDVPVTVVLGSTQVPIRRLLQLGPGAVLKLQKPIEAPADLYLKDSKFAEADVVVVEDHFAVRIRQIMAVNATDRPAEGPSA